MSLRTPALAIVLAGLALVGCDGTWPPRARAKAPPPPTVAVPARERSGPIRWNPAKGAFEYAGRTLRAEKLWTFDGSTEGFLLINGEVAPADHAGLTLRELRGTGILRTPSGLHVDGHARSLLLVRLTRLRPGRAWDSAAYYSTLSHGETAAYFAKPVSGGDPEINETVILVYDMHHLTRGADDWKTSLIDQVRIDLDDAPGGAFLVRQVAIAQRPPGVSNIVQAAGPP